MSKKTKLLAAALLLVPLMASACSGAAEKKEPVTIRVLLPFPGDNLAMGPPYLETAENFHLLHPDITVTFDQVPGNMISTKDVADRLNSAEPPDIVPFAPKEGMLVDLLSLAESKEIDINPRFLETVKVGGELLQLPYSFDTNAVLYNKIIFDQAQIPYPQGEWTWEQFRDVSRKLQSRAGAAMPYDLVTLNMLMASIGMSLISPEGDTHAGYLDSPEAARVIRWLNGYYRDISDQPTPLGALEVWENFSHFQTRYRPLLRRRALRLLFLRDFHLLEKFLPGVESNPNR